ncbi:insulinase family protein [Clostridium tagluense]|uniref:M16 family metallopeptidase n=1 Tax=Clostridium tagluense TaxID=360422 RepID=UPI001C0E8448|nr:pitrilysin family protein [Clostridium tagluense]MBU3126710.1 insulinase family protein [Clostridium tagluense]MCB2310069.1 insulinase family protein [Clostridium tagluense]MCB2314401.1 insulinase family protein [Clostridium tagluense]MCB2319247.1 insulinase family protein [Clostridium tagluense]MCB2324663.1 insulinase family protein [Clostridium tagluense]
MEKITFENGVKLIYRKAENNLTSFTIGFNAGANREENNDLGMAHVVEHMLFKGTASRTEYQINKLCDETFGFCNAMTNYPYAVYYGTTLDEDFEKGFEIYSDIILNPTFKGSGFKEEIDVISAELKEWKDDSSQFCEDSMLYNGFNKRRIKNLIIGTEESIRSITIDRIKNFYHKNYTSDNCVVSIISSMSFKSVSDIVEKYLCNFNNKLFNLKHHIEGAPKYIYENNNPGTYFEYRDDLQGAKIQYCFPIHDLNDREISALKLFSIVFGEGTSSILYDEIRTKRGLVYDISSKIKNETGIKLFTITLGTSYENVNKTIEIINNQIEEVKKIKGYFDGSCLLKLCKSYKLRRMLALEKSIQTSMSLCVYEIMYGDGFGIFSEFKAMENIKEAEIMKVVNSVLVNPTIQILMPKNSAVNIK